MMIRLTVFVAMLISALSGYAEKKSVYLFQINDEIGATSWHHTRQALNEASEAKADMVLLHLNTYGGEVVYADSIRTALLHSTIPTVAFVDNNAASAGALIALACDTVYMRPDGSMGAATVVNGADGAAMPDKYQSYMRAMMRATAERHGKYKNADSTWQWRRDPSIAEAMVDSRVVVDGLIDSTKVLTFTPDEAIKWGYADGKAESVSEVLSALDVNDYRIIKYEPTWVDTFMGFLMSTGVQAILIMIIMGGIYFELQTPGMGFPSVAAIVAALLYFMPLYLTGIVSSWIVLLFLAGLILLLLEIFVIPGFGITGIAGALMMVAAVFIGLLENFSFSPDEFDYDFSAVWKACLTMLLATAAAIGGILFLTSRFGPKFITNRSELHHSQRVEDGYIAVDASLSALVGAEAVTVTDMHPSGKITIEGNEYDAVSQRGYIESGTAVKVVRYENAQLYVVPLVK